MAAETGTNEQPDGAKGTEGAASASPSQPSNNNNNNNNNDDNQGLSQQQHGDNSEDVVPPTPAAVVRPSSRSSAVSSTSPSATATATGTTETGKPPPPTPLTEATVAAASTVPATAAATTATPPQSQPPAPPAPPPPEQQEDEEPAFPLLQNNASSETLAAAAHLTQKSGGKGHHAAAYPLDDDYDNDEEPAVAKPFVRTTSPDSGAPTARGGGIGGEKGSSLLGGMGGVGEKFATVVDDDDYYYHDHDEDDDDDDDDDDDGTIRDDYDDADDDHGDDDDGGEGGSGDREKRKGRGTRTGTRPSSSARAKAAKVKAKAARSLYKMHKFTLYETASRYYIVGGDVMERRYRILKVDRNTHEPDAELSIVDDRTVYTPREMNALLDTIDDGNKGTGGIKQRSTAWGLLGFIKFTGPYYMLLITKKSTVAMIGGHYVYQVDGTELIPLTPPKYKPDVRNMEESRFLAILNNLDLTRSFYYSYSYDITRSLQHNITRERTALIDGLPWATYDDYNSMFVWNSHLLSPASDALHDSFDWCRPIIHGYIDQAAISIYGRTAHITIIARRSRFFAGARFLKRGANDLGYVANDVETEQIVSESLTTSFHLPGPKLFASPQYTSYVQHRGSIPLYWTQDNTGVTPKPPIELNLVDPFYTAAALHFDNLFERYGSPIYVLNLIKAKERTPRESKLLVEYTNAIDYLNQFLPEEHRIYHEAWDMSRAAKSRDQNVIGTLESIAESVVTTTGFFHNGDGVMFPMQVQNGVARTNCIDCLDRTNAAQFVIGKRALGYQLHALGIIEEASVEYDTDAVNLFTHMWHDHGDTIAVQYGGSQLVNTMETYRKINQWTSHSRDMIESFKRYYNNSFMDSQRQEAYNLFLGNYIFAQGQPMLWDLATDYYLHHADPRAWSQRVGRHYMRWYTPAHLEKRSLPAYHPPPRADGGGPPKPVSFYDDYWLEYYRPATLSSFMKMFPYKMNSTIKYIPLKSTQEGKYDLSPFRVRNDERAAAEHQHQQEANDRKKAPTKKEVVIVDPQEARNNKNIVKNSDRIDNARMTGGGRSGDTTPMANSPIGKAGGSGSNGHTRGISIQRWLQPMAQQTGSPAGGGGGSGTLMVPQSIMKEQTAERRRALAAHMAEAAKHKEKTKAAQWTFTQVVHESLNPSVSAQEMEDYASYVTHPQTLPLVVSSNEDDFFGGGGGVYADSHYQQQHHHLGSGGAGAAGDDDDATAAAAAASEYRGYLYGSWQTEGLGGISSKEEEEDVAAYAELLRIGDSPLTVVDGDLAKKRYKAYRKWLRGKSLFKQQPVD